MGLSTSPVITPPPPVNWLAFQPAGSGSTLQALAHSVIVPFTRPHSVSKGGAFTGRMMGLGIQGHEIGVAQLHAMKAEITDRRITKALWDQLGPNAQHFLLAQVKKGMAEVPNGFGLGMGPEEYELFISRAIQEAQRMSKAEPSALEQKNQEIAVRNEKLESTAKWINMFGPKSSSIESALMQILNERTQGMELNQADQVLNKILSDPTEMDTIYRSALQRLGDPAAGLGKPRENAKEYLRAYYQLVTGIKDPSLLNALADQTLSQIELSIPNKELNPVQKVDHFLRFFISGSPQTNQELIVSSGLKMLTPRLDAKTPPEALRGPLAEWLFRTVASDPNVQKLRKQLEASGINPEKDERLLSLNAQVAIQKLQWLNSRSKLANETLNSIIKGAQNLPIPSAQGTTQPPAWPNALPEALPEKFTDLPPLAQEIYKNLAAAHGLEAAELFYEQKRLRAAGKWQATAQDAADSLTTNRTQSSSNLSPLSSSNIAANMSEVERNSAIRDGKAWLKKEWGIDLDSPTTTNRQIAETILKAINEGKFAPATAVNVWTALASKERSREVESVLKEPSDFILKSTTLEGALAAGTWNERDMPNGDYNNWDWYFSPQPASKIGDDFRSRYGLDPSRRVPASHDVFSHLLQTANEITTAGYNLTAVIDAIIYLLKQGRTMSEVRQKIKSRFESEMPNINDITSYILGEIKENAALNNLPISLFLERLDDGNHHGTLKLRRPADMLLEAKPR